MWTFLIVAGLAVGFFLTGFGVCALFVAHGYLTIEALEEL